LAANRSIDFESMRHRYEVLKALDTSRQAQDLNQDIDDQEKRMGMRAALRERQRKCSACLTVPTGMQPTNCDVCGNYKARKI
ncbi:mobilome CxxCx(11)CxxC protein, partial [Streptomyces sp. NPDC052644]